MNPKRLVIDTNVFIRDLLNPLGTPRQVIDRAAKEWIILQSETTYRELKTRLCKKKFDKYLAASDREDFLASLADNSLFIEVTHQTSLCSDADDNQFLELAISGMARYLITGDNDLLILNIYQEIPILTPAQFLEIA